MTDAGNPLLMTSLKCSLCDNTIAEFPGILASTESVSIQLCMDLMRVCINHGYKCPQKQEGTNNNEPTL